MAVQNLITKSLDAIALASLKELVEVLRKENMHPSAEIVERLARDFTDRYTVLLPFAAAESALQKTGILVEFLQGDPIVIQIDRVAQLWRQSRLDHVLIRDLCEKLGYKKRWAGIEWVKYVAGRGDQVQSAIVRIYGAWAAMVPPIEGISVTHPIFAAAYNALNGIED